MVHEHDLTCGKNTIIAQVGCKKDSMHQWVYDYLCHRAEYKAECT